MKGGAPADHSAAGASDGSLVVVRSTPLNAETPPTQLTEPVTPATGVYVRTNFGIPELPVGRHCIAIGGAVGSPFELRVEELAELPRRSITCTMECAGNDRMGISPLPDGEPWGGGAVSTAEWSGVPLRELLRRAAMSPDAIEVLVEGADSGDREDATGDVTFGRALPVSDALSADVLLATEMNGMPLTPAHGAPLRLVVPGWYGMASVKWVTRVTALTRSYTGYFQTRRYVFENAESVRPVTRMRVKSIIAWPIAAAVLPVGTAEVWGWAWSGEGAIRRVELARDGGDRWENVTLDAPASPHAWVRWRHRVEFPASGRYVLRSRATDASGNTQPDLAPWNRLGYGNNAVRQVTIEVR